VCELTFAELVEDKRSDKEEELIREHGQEQQKQEEREVEEENMMKESDNLEYFRKTREICEEKSRT